MKHHLTLVLAFTAAIACSTSVDLGGVDDAGGQAGDSGHPSDHRPDGGEVSHDASAPSDASAEHDAGKIDDAGARTACTPGKDATCNADLAMSALAGICNANGTCRCEPGFAINAFGRCAVAEAGDAGTGCASADTTQACVTCCQRPAPSLYGGFELAGYDLCLQCPACQDGSGPCAGNVTAPAGAACVQCLQAQIAERGVPDPCARSSECNGFAVCMNSCPLR